MRQRLVAAVVVLLVVAAGCGDDDPADSAATPAAEGGQGQGASTSQAPAGEQDSDEAPADDGTEGPATAGGTLGLASTGLGEIVVDAEGRTLYLFMPDDRSESTCYDQCEAAWPPTPEAAGVGDGLDAGLLGTTSRTDGTVQATYNGWPLYHFARDAAAGDTNGQGVNDVWYVIDAAGNPVQQAQAAATTASTAGTPGY